MCENIDVITIHQLLASYSNHFSVVSLGTSAHNFPNTVRQPKASKLAFTKCVKTFMLSLFTSYWPVIQITSVFCVLGNFGSFPNTVTQPVVNKLAFFTKCVNIDFVSVIHQSVKSFQCIVSLGA